MSENLIEPDLAGEAEALLALIERRVSYVAARSRRVAQAFFAGGQLGPDVWAPPQGDEPSPPTARQIERFARQWAVHVPRNPHRRAALARLLLQRYRLALDEAPGLRVALHLDEPAVDAAYLELYGTAPAADFAAGSSAAEGGDDESLAQREMEADLEWVSLEAGEVLMREGEPSDAAYIVVSGRLGALRDEPGKPDALLSEAGRGELLGEMGVITGGRRSATVVAVRDSELVRLPKASFDRLMQGHPRAMMQVVRSLIERVERRNQRRQARAALSIAVVAETPGLPLGDFACRLTEAMAALGPTLHLSSRAADAALGAGASQTPHRAAEFGHLLAWLGEREGAVRYAIYEADPQPTAWTRCCLHQADRVLVVVAAGDQPQRLPTMALFESGDTAWRAPRQELVVLGDDARPCGTTVWLDATGAVTQHHVRLSAPDDLARLARLLTGRGFGLVLGSGGSRAHAHIGAIRALEEEGIPIDLVGGSSAGAMIAGQVAMGQDYAAVLEANRAMVRLGRKLIDFTVPFISFIAARRLDQVLLELFGDRLIEDLPLKFFCVSCNITRSRPMVHERGMLRRFVRASSGIPGVLPPVCEDGELLVDGAVVDAIPVGVARGLLAGGTVFAVDVSRDVFFDGDASIVERYSGAQLLWERLKRVGRPKLAYPNVLALMSRAAEVGSAAQREASRPLADAYVEPPLGTMSFFETERLEETVEIGYRAAREAIAAWRARQAAIERGDVER